jgi:hypothetical protein
MNNNKVFVGPGNIAGSAMYMAKALRLVGIDSTSFSFNSHPFGYPCDHDNILFKNPFGKEKKRNIFQKLIVNRITLNTFWVIQKLILFFYSILKFDTFIFISHETFFERNNDLWVLKLLNKKIAFLFMGCPERDPKNLINQTDRGICSFCIDKEMQKSLNCYNGTNKKMKIEKISKYADFIFGHRDTTTFVTDKNKIKLVFISSDLRIDENELLGKYNDTSNLNVTHIPSNSLLKGTDSVIKTINELKLRNYHINFFSKQIKHFEVDNLLMDTHILIDQFSVGHGLLAVEGMAHGCVVICRTAKWFREDYPELPLISCDPEELTDVLVDLISNPQKMLRIAKESMEYFNKFHTPEVVGNYYKKTLNLS